MSAGEWRQPSVRPEPYAYRPRADGTVKCRECGDSDWVEQESSLTGTPTVRPCSNCLPKVYDRWAAGFPRLDGDRRHGTPEFVPEPTRQNVTPIPMQEQF